MKKLLVLLMVLGLVSSAQAALSLSLGGQPAPDEISIAPSTIVMIDVTSDTTLSWTGYLWLDEDTYGDYGEWVLPMNILPAAGSSATAKPNYGSYPGYWQLVAAGNPVPPGEIQIGKHFEIGFHCKALGDVVIQLLDSDEFTVLDSITIHQIPEPMTIGLLGLGGLFLRRRK